jgi:quercetin dioxygenase-like cupin family protein
MTVFDWNRVSGVEVSPGNTVWAAKGEQVQLVRTELAAGMFFEIHQHPQEQMSYVLEGELEVTVGSEVYRVGPGQVVHLRPNVPHSTRIIGAGPACTLEVFAPPRVDLRHDSAA